MPTPWFKKHLMIIITSALPIYSYILYMDTPRFVISKKWSQMQILSDYIFTCQFSRKDTMFTSLLSLSSDGSCKPLPFTAERREKGREGGKHCLHAAVSDWPITRLPVGLGYTNWEEFISQPNSVTTGKGGGKERERERKWEAAYEGHSQEKTYLELLDPLRVLSAKRAHWV